MNASKFGTLLGWLALLIGLGLFVGCSDEPDQDENANIVDEDAGGGDPDIGDKEDADAAGEEPDAHIPEDAGGDEEADCVPSEEAWQQNIEPIVEEYCGECHGETPQYGAPFSLTDYDVLIDGEEGDRPVDAVTDVLVAGDMPPATSPQLPHAELDALVAWSSCGEEHPDYGQDLEASVPVWEAPEDPPEGLDSFELTADGYEVPHDMLDEYRCFAMEVPLESEKLMRRIEPIIDDGRVLHHFVMSVDRSQQVELGDFGCPLFPPGDEHVYAWGPGQTALEFDDGGIRLGPDDRLVLQIHYNNGAGFEDVVDSSGLRIYYESPEDKTEYVMAEQYTMSINIPPEDTAEVSTSCTVSQEVDLIGTWPHMHEIGSEFEHTVTRGDGSEETIIALTGWHFEAQYLYYTPMTLYPGDELHLTCRWDNPHDYPVTFGTGTEDEMCFSFMYVTPPHTNFCQ